MILKILVFAVVATAVLYFLFVYLPKQVKDNRRKSSPKPEGLDNLVKKAEKVAEEKTAVQTEIKISEKKINQAKRKIS